MSFSLVYLVNRFFYQIAEFLRHWYWDGFLWFSRQTLNFLEILDRRLALKITLRNFFKPLYQDYTAVGYILGVFFRFWRSLIGFAVYSTVSVVALSLYLLWAALSFLIPVLIQYK